MKSNTKTISYVLHTSKGSFLHYEDLLTNFDGVPEAVLEEIKSEFLKRSNVATLSGGLTRKFFTSFNEWIDEILPKWKDCKNNVKQQEFFEKSLSNLKWILLLTSEITRIVYSSSITRDIKIYNYLYVLTSLLYIAGTDRWGMFFFSKYIHCLLIHLPQDYINVIQRITSCERGEYLLSIIKRIVKTNSWTKIFQIELLLQRKKVLLVTISFDSLHLRNCWI